MGSLVYKRLMCLLGFLRYNVMCVFLRGVGIVGATPTQYAKVDLQGRDSCREKDCDLDVQVKIGRRLHGQ